MTVGLTIYSFFLCHIQSVNLFDHVKPLNPCCNEFPLDASCFTLTPILHKIDARRSQGTIKISVWGTWMFFRRISYTAEKSSFFLFEVGNCYEVCATQPIPYLPQTSSAPNFPRDIQARVCVPFPSFLRQPFYLHDHHKVETLVTIHVHQRDVMNDLSTLHRQKRISDANDFEWLKQVCVCVCVCVCVHVWVYFSARCMTSFSATFVCVCR